MEQSGQSRGELAAIFLTAALCACFGALGVNRYFPEGTGVVSRDARCVVRDVSWALSGVTIEGVFAALDGQNRRFQAALAPRRLKPARNPVQEYNALLK